MGVLAITLPGATGADARVSARTATPTACRDLFRRDFAPIRTYDPRSFVVTDVNSDGRDDIVYGSGTIGVLLSRRDGSFDAPPPAGLGIGVGLMAGDLNEDGHPDLLTTGDNGDVTTLIGDGKGQFTVHERFQGPGGFSRLADFDHDGHLDVMALGTDGSVYVATMLRGDGTGGFALASRTFVGLGGGLLATAVGDFDADGALDLVFGVRTGAGRTSIAFGDGAGGFRSVRAATEWTGQASSLAVADFNRDGNADLGISPVLGTAVLAGDGHGRFRRLPRSPIVSLDFVGAIAGDFDGDGSPDLADASAGDGEVYVWLNDGDGRFALVEGGPEWGGHDAARGPVAGDFNGDGRLDLAGSSNALHGIRVFLNTGWRRRTGNQQAIQFVYASQRFGGDVVLGGRLRCHPGRIDLYRRRPNGRWRRIARVATDFRGMAIHTDHPRATVQYQWRPIQRTRRIRPTRPKTIVVSPDERR